MSLKQTEAALRKFAKGVVRSARQNLTKQKQNDSKGLYNSIDYKIEVGPNSFSLKFFMNQYGLFQDRGVDGTVKKYRLATKLPNLSREFKQKFSYKSSSNLLGLEAKTGLFGKWAKRKGIRLRNKKGQYVSFKQAGFMIAHNKKRVGIKPSLFFTRPFLRLFDNLPDELVEAYGLDVMDFLEFNLGEILNNES